MSTEPLAPRLLRVSVPGGLVIEADVRGHEGNPPLMFLHGGGQTRHAWAEAATRFAAEGFFVIASDLRGHGGSGWSEDGDYSVPRHADDLRALASTLSRPPILVGASLGGLTTLIACGEQPRLDASLVLLVDVAHRARPRGISRIVEFMRGHPDGFGSVDEAAATVAAYLPQRATPTDTSGLRKNLRRREDGRWRWHWDPRLLEAFADPIGAVPSPERLLAAAKALPSPLVLVRGGSSDVIDEAIANELIAEVPGARLINVRGAAHMVAGDRNDRLVDAIREALRVGVERSRADACA